MPNQPTERIYYTDSYCTRFSAHVVERLTWGSHPAVVLDRTAFYPTSGGQPADRGTLSEVEVHDVVVREEDGAVVHVLSAEPASDEVEGVLDWARRFDHMQQHTGQHILSAAFEHLLDADTVGFHLGTEMSTVDINLARLTPTDVASVEDLSNRVIWEDCPVHVRMAGAAEVAELPLRRPPTVDGTVRIVEIGLPEHSELPARPGRVFDANPCGGTHVARTGEVGLLKIVRLECRGGETQLDASVRIEFLCGARALHDYRTKHELITRLATKFTTGYRELEQTMERLQSENKQLWHDLRQARKQLLEGEARELAANAPIHGPYRIVSRVWEQPGKPPEELRTLAQDLTQQPGTLALLFSSVDERTHLCFACAEEVNVDMTKLLRDVCTQLGGKGGGRPQMAQGSAPTTDAEQIQIALTRAKEAVLADLRE